MSHHHVRVVDKQGTIRFECLALHIDPTHRRRTLGKRLTVIQSGDKLELWHNQKPIPFTTFDIKAWRTQVQDRKALDAMLDQRPALPRNDARKPAANHPWRHTPI